MSCVVVAFQIALANSENKVQRELAKPTIAGIMHMNQIAADLGAKGTGPGVRPPERVANPKPLFKRIDTEYD